MKLISCAQCSRHVKDGAPCPFCGAVVRSAAPEPSARQRAVRAAMLAGAAAVVACGGAIDTSLSDGGGTDAAKDTGRDTGAVVVPYGVPPLDAGTAPDASTTIQDASTKDVTIAPPYGAPPH